MFVAVGCCVAFVFVWVTTNMFCFAYACLWCLFFRVALKVYVTGSAFVWRLCAWCWGVAYRYDILAALLVWATLVCVVNVVNCYVVLTFVNFWFCFPVCVLVWWFTCFCLIVCGIR